MKPPSLNVVQKNCQMRVTRKNSFPDRAPLSDKCYWKTFSPAKCPSITLPYSQVSLPSVRANSNYALFTGRMSRRQVMRGGTYRLCGFVPRDKISVWFNKYIRLHAFPIRNSGNMSADYEWVGLHPTQELT